MTTASPSGPSSDAAPKLSVVGIGASAGGLEALETVLRRLTIEEAAFVVVQHLSPDHDSLLGELLGRATKMKVVTITDGTKVEANHVYVIPPNADVAILHGVLHLMAPPAGRGPRLPIDYFFRSLAADQAESAVGVILSGTGTDGCLGLKAIKAEGGLTIVQDPATAKYDGMPRSALGSGYADVCLSPEALGLELSRLVRHPHLLTELAPGRDQAQEHLGKIFILIRKEFGNDLTHYKHSTIERRIERRMALHKLETLSDYARYLQSNVGELAILYKDILISVTSFFRDPQTFETLKTTVFPRLLERKKVGDPIRIWTAGSSTGEEAYSVAIALLEFLGERAVDYRIQLFGTDVDAGSIRHARRGLYLPNIALDVSPERLHRFFRAHDSQFLVTRAVRDLLVFATQNLTKDAPFSHVDLVTCRNVLIYLQPVLQKKVLRILHYALNPDGFLLLGTSETVGDLPDLFSLVDRKSKLYVKKNITSTATFDLNFGGGDAGAPQLPGPPRDVRPVATLQQVVDRRLLDRYAPPGVLINEAFEILQYRGQTGPYLEPTPGTASLHVLKNARPELQAELRALLHRARTEGVAVTGGPIPLPNRQTGELRNITIDVVPVQDAAARAQCQLVVFKEAASPATDAAEDSVVGDGAPARRMTETHVRDIERELLATKEYLQSTVGELETANEELKSSNEELQSSNEELQSTNEELETSKEELQSSNEELTTVNDELQNRMGELGQSNDDLANVLSGVEIAVLIIGVDRRIRRFSGNAEKLLNLVPGDVGRSLSHLTPYVKNADLARIVDKVVTRAAAVQQTVTIGEAWYAMRVVPYLTGDHSIRGAIVLFHRIDEEQPTPDQALAAAESAGATLVAIKHPLLILDERLRVIWANTAFHQMFKITARDLTGSSLQKRWAHPKLLELLEQTVATDVPFKNFSVSYDFAGIGPRTISVEGSVIPSQGGPGGAKLILLVVEGKATGAPAKTTKQKTKQKPAKRKLTKTKPRRRRS